MHTLVSTSFAPLHSPPYFRCDVPLHTYSRTRTARATSLLRLSSILRIIPLLPCMNQASCRPNHGIITTCFNTPLSLRRLFGCLYLSLFQGPLGASSVSLWSQPPMSVSKIERRSRNWNITEVHLVNLQETHSRCSSCQQFFIFFRGPSVYFSLLLWKFRSWCLRRNLEVVSIVKILECACCLPLLD
jgi:hypothetical protein